MQEKNGLAGKHPDGMIQKKKRKKRMSDPYEILGVQRGASEENYKPLILDGIKKVIAGKTNLMN